MDMTNAGRAQRAETALREYVEAKGEVFETSSSEIADLMADLLHLAVRLDEVDDAVSSTLRLARLHFDAEHGNPEEEGAAAMNGSIKIITVRVEGGLVQDVIGVPHGIEVRVEDYDDGDESHPTWDAEKECHLTIYEGGAS
jgi:hypothetical protein